VAVYYPERERGMQWEEKEAEEEKRAGSNM